MSDDEKIELERGSGNVFRDFGRANADVLQAKATLAARIIGVLDDEKISVRAAHRKTGFAAQSARQTDGQSHPLCGGCKLEYGGRGTDERYQRRYHVLVD